MPEEFVRKDVLDANIQRIEAVVDKNLAELRGEMNELRGEMRSGFALMNERMEKNLAEYRAVVGDIRAEVSDLRGDVKALAGHLQALEFWGAIVIGTAAVFFALMQYNQNKREIAANESKEETRELRKTVLELVEAGKIAGRAAAV